MPAGRPSKYDPAFCEQVEETMRSGFSKMAAAGRLGVCYDTLKNWMGEHPEFFAAVKRGEAARTEKLETDLLSAETGPQVTSRIFALKNAAPDEWRDKQHTEHSTPPGRPLQIEAAPAADVLRAKLDEIASRRAGGTSAE